jgi:hypothetical protein
MSPGAFNPHAGTYDALFGKSDDAALYLAVIKQHIEDAAMSYPAGAGGTDRADRIRQEARAWLLEPNAGFEEVCALAGVEPRDVRKVALAKIEAFDRQHPEVMHDAARREEEARARNNTVIVRQLGREAEREAECKAKRRDREAEREAKLTARLAARRTRKLYEIDGEQKTLTEWAAVAGVTVATLMKRMYRMSLAEAVAMPNNASIEASRLEDPIGYTTLQGGGPITRTLTHNCETLTIKQWSERTGIKYFTINYRLRKGRTVEEALTP